MATMIDGYLENVRKVAEREQVKNERLAALLQYEDEKNQARVLGLAALLLPEAVREFASFNYWGDSYYNGEHRVATIRVTLPNCAPIWVFLKVIMSDEIIVTDCHLDDRWGGGAFSIAMYEVTDGEHGYIVVQRSSGSYGTFDQAAYAAMTAGDNKEVIAEEAQRRNNARQEPVREEILQCPLTVMVEAETGYCVRTQCAWWAERKQACAVKALALLMPAWDNAE